MTDLILHHGVERAVRARVVETDHLVDEAGPLGSGGVRDALLDHVRRELVLRERQHLALDRVHDAQLVLRLAVLCEGTKLQGIRRLKYSRAERTGRAHGPQVAGRRADRRRGAVPRTCWMT